MSKTLNPKQELFCKLYTSGGEFFGNGVQAYIKAYEPNQAKRGWYKSAQSSASRLLSNVIICRHICELLETDGLNNVFVDKQILFLITQFTDFNAKIRAIQEYNKLKKRITDKVDMNINAEKPIDVLNEIRKAIHKYKTNGNRTRQ